MTIEKLIEEGNYTAALDEVRLLLATDRYNTTLLQLQARILHKLADHTEVVEVYNTLINLLPSDADSYAGRGIAFYHLGHHRLSLADFDKAVALEPANGYRYASRAYIKDNLGDHLGALADYTRAIELDPEDAISLNNRGLVEEKLGRQHLAQESFARADELAGVDPGKLSYPKSPAPPRPPRRVGLKQFFATLKSLLTSAGERKRFYRFLFNR